MDRRNFIGKLLAVGAGFTVLPPAATARIWKAQTPEPYLEIITPTGKHTFKQMVFSHVDADGQCRFKEWMVRIDEHGMRFQRIP